MEKLSYSELVGMKREQVYDYVHSNYYILDSRRDHPGLTKEFMINLLD